MKSLLSTCSTLQYYRLIKFCIGFCHVFELHTPAWEATQIGAVASYADAILIHVPTRGATPRKPSVIRPTYFNSRPYARGDVVPLEALDHIQISIHAPTQGATDCFFTVQASFGYFNSRPYARGDPQRQRSPQRCRKFQFTPLRKGRQQKICVFSRSFVQPLQIIVL